MSARAYLCACICPGQLTAAHSRLRRSWPLTERLRRSTARLRRDTLIPRHCLSPRVMWVMKMLAYRYVRAVHDHGVEGGGDDDGGDDGWIDRSSERTFTLACMLMAWIVMQNDDDVDSMSRLQHGWTLKMAMMWLLKMPILPATARQRTVDDRSLPRFWVTSKHCRLV